MENEEDAASAADPETEPDPADANGAPASSTEKRIRRLTGRSAAYRGRLVGITRGWVSRDAKLHVLAARFLDFVVLTPDHLVLCSTGFFTRRPRRRVFREPLSRLVVIPRGPEPFRILRIVGDFDRPILLELRNKPDAIAFAQELLARTKSEAESAPLSNRGPDSDTGDSDTGDSDTGDSDTSVVEYEHVATDPLIERPPAP